MRRIVIEGWRGMHHSYALVAQSHALCLLGRADLDLRYRDLPLFSEHWRHTGGVFTPEQERRIAAIPSAVDTFAPDVTWSLRPEVPDFTDPVVGCRMVFGTPECRVLPRVVVERYGNAAKLSPSIGVVTPSRWTAAAYERFGFDAQRVHVVPHGVDPDVMRPDEHARIAARQALKADDAFVFMSIGAMTPNKGIGMLLAAFGMVAEHHPHARLVLKGADALYPSQDFLRSALLALPSGVRERVASRLLYQGKTLSTRQMATFMQAADCYVAPYIAEGFNMPVLEAAACGVPVIVTAGGPTDEFTTPSFADYVQSAIVPASLPDGQAGEALAPDRDHLIGLMKAAVADPQGMRRRGAAGARHVHAHFTWEAMTERLLGAFRQHAPATL